MSKEMREQIERVKNWKQLLNENIENHTDKYKNLIKRYEQVKNQYPNIDSDFNRNTERKILINFKGYGSYINTDLIKSEPTIFSFLENNKIIYGELFSPKNENTTKDCIACKIENLEYTDGKIIGDVTFIDSEIGRLAQFLMKKNKHMTFSLKRKEENNIIIEIYNIDIY